jgi:16S rRNA G527 N7-methylase RsmG
MMGLKQLYIDRARGWNSTHRILGRDIDSIVAQSEEALKNWLKDYESLPNAVIDVGAGSGVGTVPLLWLNPDVKIYFIEPDVKKAAFLLSLSREPEFKSRTKVVSERVELVSRETVGLGQNPGVLLVRAFSGDKSLSEVVQKSQFKNDVWFNFETKNESFYYSPLKIS